MGRGPADVGRDRVYQAILESFRARGVPIGPSELVRRSKLGMQRQTVQYHVDALTRDGRVSLVPGIDPVRIPNTAAVRLSGKLRRVLMDIEAGDDDLTIACRERVALWRVRVLRRWLEDAIGDVPLRDAVVFPEQRLGQSVAGRSGKPV